MDKRLRARILESMPLAPPVLRTAIRLGAVALIGIAVVPRLPAQDTTATRNLQPTPDSQLVKLTLRDGSVLIGRVLSVTPSVVQFTSAVGQVAIPRESIRSIERIAARALHDGEYWPEDPSRTRLFFAPTGRMQHAGEVYFADAYVFFPSFQAGLSSLVSLGGGFSVLPGLGIDEQVFYLTPKVGLFASPRVNVAVGALVAGAGSLTDEGPFGLGYGVATFGGEDGSITAGAGFGFARSRTSQAVFMLGGSRRVSRNIALVSENYLYSANSSSVLVSGGIRFMGERLSVDLAGFTVGDSSVPIIPYLAFIYRL